MKSILKGKTIVSYSPETGGHISSCIIDGIELFHNQFGDSNKPKGGMPYMFPNAGSLTDEQSKKSGLNLAQHGFGRTSAWRETDDGEQELVFEATKEFPFRGAVKTQIEITDDGSVIFHQYITNLGQNRMPISTGLHPYFRIPNGDKSAVEFRIEGRDEILADRGIWSDNGTGEYDTPSDRKIIFYIPGIGEITLELSEQYSKFWVWSLNDTKGEKDFLCIEPVMNSVGGIADTPVWVEPRETNHNWMKVSLNT